MSLYLAPCWTTCKLGTHSVEERFIPSSLLDYLQARNSIVGVEERFIPSSLLDYLQARNSTVRMEERFVPSFLLDYLQARNSIVGVEERFIPSSLLDYLQPGNSIVVEQGCILKTSACDTAVMTTNNLLPTGRKSASALTRPRCTSPCHPPPSPPARGASTYRCEEPIRRLALSRAPRVWYGSSR